MGKKWEECNRMIEKGCIMASKIIEKALTITNSYLIQNYSKNELKSIHKELTILLNCQIVSIGIESTTYSYEEVQNLLSNLNEKESIRKDKGVYYTPNDVVKFILTNCVKLACDRLRPNNIHVMGMNGIPYKSFCYEKTVYDPTCGSGVFLLEALEMKLDLLDLHNTEVTKGKIQRVVCSIKGNDLNSDSIAITKMRLFLCVLHRHGVAKIRGIAELMNRCFANYDFVTETPNINNKYDIIVGNPPYVEDSKSDSLPRKRYGNIYANVLENSALHLKSGGVLGFVIPLSYVSTPRMQSIRDELYKFVPEQYILSYSDRPDCLFTSVHQKLCILFGKNSNADKTIYTGNYRYWYREERGKLFNTTEVVNNSFVLNEYIPKLGTDLDASIYRKIKNQQTPLIQLLENDNDSLFVNMRAAFWIKAFLNEHTGSEYKEFHCLSRDYAHYCMCLLNSSLFWWYWICVSDCWHITKKELQGFMVPEVQNFDLAIQLAVELEDRLERTKLYVGTKQTEYEYKHKDCVAEIHHIDDYINDLYGLTEEESIYIKNFAYRYRTGGGVEDDRD